MDPTVARGMAWAAILAVVIVLARAGVLALSRDDGTAVPVCDTPVEVVTELGPRLDCARDLSCPGLRAGDRVSPECRIERDGMAAATRLLVGVPLDVNRASLADLELLKGIGPHLAEAIVTERERARFESVDDLIRVKGIGPVRLEAMRPFVTIGSD